MKMRMAMLTVAALAVVTMAVAGGAGAETAVRIDALEEFRAVLVSLAYSALPNEDFDYIKKSKMRFELAYDSFKRVKLPPLLNKRERYFKVHHDRTRKAADRFKSVMTSRNLGQIKTRLLELDREFTLLMAVLAPSPAELAVLDRAVTPMWNEHVEQGQFEQVPEDLVALREAVERLSAAELHTDLGFLAQDFAVRSTRVRNATAGLGASIEQQDTIAVRLAATEMQRANESLKDLFRFWQEDRVK